jgi:hypothetical protein
MLPRGWAALAIVAASATSASAQLATDHFGIERFRLASDRAGLLDVEWAGVPDHLSWGAGVVVGFAHDPLVLYDRDMNVIDAVVDRRLTTSVQGALGLYDRLSIGVAIDVVGYQTGSDAATSPTMRTLPGGGIGDLRLLAKVLAVGDARYQVAFIPALTIPGAGAKGYLREAGVVFAPAVAASMRAGSLRAAVNLGYVAKPRVDTAGLISDDEAFAKLGLGYTIGGERAPILDAWWTTSFAAPLGDRTSNQVAIEMLAGVGRQLTPAVGVFVAGGTGLDNGFGTPDWRALAGVRYELAAGDRDGDRIEGAADKCPDDAEDLDGFADSDGCPDPDNDGDGVADAADRCAQEAEDNDGFQDTDGCADPDNDGDGVADAQDRCPLQAEDKDGFQDTDGCADAKATVAGSVVDPDGRPIGGASVTIVQLELPDATPIQLTSDPDGKFTATLDGGQLQITARARDYKESSTEATVAPGSSGPLVVKVVRAVRAGQLRGQVLSFDGQPLTATINVKGPKGNATATTDAEGRFTVELPEGAFSVEIVSAGFVSQTRSVKIKLDGVTVLNVDLRSTK